MNSAINQLYDELLSQVDEQDAGRKPTVAEKAKQFQEEKRVTIHRLQKIDLKRQHDEEIRKEEARKRKLERKRQAAIEARVLKEKHEQEMIRDLEEKTLNFWKRDVTGERKLTGASYFGDAIRHGDAWVPHGHGEYRVRSEVIYEGDFSNGMMHGEGRLLFKNGQIWAGHFWKNMVQGLGTLVDDDETKRKAIYWRDRRVCFLQELTPGLRIQLLSDEFVRNEEGEATILSATHREGQYRVRLEDGKEKLLRLDFERFRLLRHRTQVFRMDTIVGSTRYKDLYDYEDDQANPKKSAYTENFYYPDITADKERQEKEEQAEHELQITRSRILAKRQAERDAKAAADQAADVAQGLAEEEQRKAEQERERAEAVEREREALAAARTAMEERKRRQRELSDSPSRNRKSSAEGEG